MIRLGGQVYQNASNVISSSGIRSNGTTLLESCDLGHFTKYLGLFLVFLFITLGTVGNTVVAVILTCTRRIFPSSTTLFIINLTISDFLTCATVMPFDIVYWLHFPVWTLQPAVCKLWNALFYTLHASSSMFIVAIGIDTYLTVSAPFHSQTIRTSRKTFTVIVVIWVWSLMVGVLIFVFQKKPPQGAYLFEINHIGYGIYLAIHMILPQILASCCYFKLFRIARLHAISIKSMQVSVTSENTPSKAQPSDKLNFREEITLAKTFLLITIAYFLCWNPFLAVQILFIFEVDRKVDWCTLETVDTVLCWFAYLQCCLNPVFYGIRKKYFRKLFEKVVRDLKD
ncbi:alpha-1A adrenergic receptor-like [Rhopilema esculentum]|uniref:alpha-1A adrenergic receptor-like n=1 Tax=Rhopilema esculentum TaxID=499914 RepID=UPI0031E2B67C|eukprot:gene2803-1027_t